MSLLEVTDIHGGYGAADILKGVSMKVADGGLAVIIGPNGAGKSTAMKAIAGLVKIRQGSVTFQGQDVTGMRADKLTAMGLSFVPQDQNVFPTLTVLENLEMGAFLVSGNLGPRLDHVYGIFPLLEEKSQMLAGNLSGGERHMVAMGRALMLEPKLLMLDEPTAGLSPKITGVIFDKIKEISASGAAVLMVEQNARHALALADWAYVLVMGKNRFEDSGQNVLANDEVATMFLGG